MPVQALNCGQIPLGKLHARTGVLVCSSPVAQITQPINPRRLRPAAQHLPADLAGGFDLTRRPVTLLVLAACPFINSRLTG